jgi:uncharacterized membrane protein
MQNNQSPSSTMSKSAILSVCSSVIGLTLIPIIGSILGIYFGFSALTEARSNTTNNSNHILSILGIVLGILGLAIWILAAIMALIGISIPSLFCCSIILEMLKSMTITINGTPITQP